LISILIAGFVLPNIFPVQTYLFIPVAEAAAPNIISYQGRLTNAAGILQNGSFDFKFSIYDDSTVGAPDLKLWPAGAPGTITLPVTDGVFNVNIGDVPGGFPDALTYDFNTNPNVYLQVEVFNSGTASFETLTPRQQITSTGYAINANSVQGRTPGTGADNLLTLNASGNIDFGGSIITTANIVAGSALTGGTALLVNTANTYTGNLVDLQVNGNSKMSVNETGSLSLDGTLTVGDGSGNDYLSFNEEATNPSCAAGEYKIWANSADGKFKKCQNGITSDLDTTGGGAGTLQDAYNNGGSIATSNAKDFDLVLSDDATDSNFDIDIVADNTVSISRIASLSAETPNQLLLLENLDSDITLPNGLLVGTGGGTEVITNALNVSDADIVNALIAGANDLSGTNWLLNGATGNFDIEGTFTSGASNAFTIDVNGNITKVGNITGGGAITIASSGAGNDIIINGADIFDVQDATTFASTVTFNSTTSFQNDDITDAEVSNTLTSSNFVGAGSTTSAIDLATAEVNGILGVSNGGTGSNTLNDLITLGTHTQGNYVASTNTSILTGLTGGTTGSEGAALTVGFDYSQALSGNVGLAANAAVFGVSGLVFEGSGADNNETFISVTNPTADQTITIPDRSGTLSLSGDTFTTDVTGTLQANGVTPLTIAAGAVTSGKILDGTIAGIDLASSISFNTTGAIGLNGGFTSAQTLTTNNSSEGSITPTQNLSATGTVNGLTISPIKSGTAAANTYTLNALNADNVTGTCGAGATCIQNALNIGTGYTNFLKTPNITIDSSGNISSAGTYNTATISGGTLSATAVNGVTTANIVLTTGSYADPAWITSLSWGKITGTPTTLSGYGITDALSNSSSSTQDAHFGDIFLQDDTTPSHYLQITDAENLTANHSLSLSVGNADRTLTINGNASINDWFDQSVKTTASPTFADITCSSTNCITLGTETAGNYVATITAGGGLTGDVSSEGSTPTLAVGAGTGITVNANDVAIDQSFAFAWTGNQTQTTTITNSGSQFVHDLTLGNDGDADTINALRVAVTSANTGDADIIYGLNLDNVTSPDATVSEYALRFGSGWDNVIDDNGTLISATELNRLDGKDAALVDTNDAVSTAIIGTGALNSGSITSGFGAIDVGADGITTSGTIGTAATTAFTGATGVFSTSTTSPSFTGTGAVTLSSGGASALTLRFSFQHSSYRSQ
jgi:hypothetical protein